MYTSHTPAQSNKQDAAQQRRRAENGKHCRREVAAHPRGGGGRKRRCRCRRYAAFAGARDDLAPPERCVYDR